MSKKKNDTFDVVIIGAGIAGLAAADALKQAKKTSFCILEGRDRPGGRTYTGFHAKGFLDMGGEFIGAVQTYLQYYINRFQLPVIPTYLPLDKNWSYQDENGKVAVVTASAFPGGNDTADLLGELNYLTLNVGTNIAEPWKTKDAGKLDKMTGQDWLDIQARNHNPVSMSLAKISMQGILSEEPANMSMLYLLYYAATAGDYSSLEGVTGGSTSAESYRFQFGTHDLISSFENAIGSEHIRYKTTVHKIEQAKDGLNTIHAVVHEGNHPKPIQIKAKKIIVAMAPPMCAKIEMPILRESEAGKKRLGLQKEMDMGRTIKGFVSFRQPFWREIGLTGESLSALSSKKAPLLWTLDNSFSEDPIAYPDTSARSSVVAHSFSLMTFIVGDAARYWSTKSFQERQKAVITQLEQIFGKNLKKYLIEGEPYVERDWGLEPLSGGCPVGIMKPMTMTKYGSALRTPVGSIHWAGTESATSWCGYMNGALQSGLRAASEVLE